VATTTPSVLYLVNVILTFRLYSWRIKWIKLTPSGIQLTTDLTPVPFTTLGAHLLIQIAISSNSWVKWVATMPSLWCLLLLSPVCFLSHQSAFHQTTVHNNRCWWLLTHPPWWDSFYLGAVIILSTLSIPSFGVEMLPIHICSSCDTSWLVIGWWLCFSGVVRGPLPLDSSLPPIFQPVHPVHNLLQAFRPLFRMKFFSFRSSLLSFHVPVSYNTHLCFLEPSQSPRVPKGRRVKGVMQKVLLGSVLFHRIQPSYSCINHWVIYLFIMLHSLDGEDANVLFSQ